MRYYQFTSTLNLGTRQRAWLIYFFQSGKAHFSQDPVSVLFWYPHLRQVLDGGGGSGMPFTVIC
jgi:hypothetical protein